MISSHGHAGLLSRDWIPMAEDTRRGAVPNFLLLPSIMYQEGQEDDYCDDTYIDPRYVRSYQGTFNHDDGHYIDDISEYMRISISFH